MPPPSGISSTRHSGRRSSEAKGSRASGPAAFHRSSNPAASRADLTACGGGYAPPGRGSSDRAMRRTAASGRMGQRRMLLARDRRADRQHRVAVRFVDDLGGGQHRRRAARSAGRHSRRRASGRPSPVHSAPASRKKVIHRARNTSLHGAVGCQAADPHEQREHAPHATATSRRTPLARHRRRTARTRRTPTRKRRKSRRRRSRRCCRAASPSGRRRTARCRRRRRPWPAPAARPRQRTIRRSPCSTSRWSARTRSGRAAQDWQVSSQFILCLRVDEKTVRPVLHHAARMQLELLASIVRSLICRSNQGLRR